MPVSVTNIDHSVWLRRVIREKVRNVEMYNGPTVVVDEGRGKRVKDTKRIGQSSWGGTLALQLASEGQDLVEAPQGAGVVLVAVVLGGKDSFARRRDVMKRK